MPVCAPRRKMRWHVSIGSACSHHRRMSATCRVNQVSFSVLLHKAHIVDRLSREEMPAGIPTVEKSPLQSRASVIFVLALSTSEVVKITQL